MKKEAETDPSFGLVSISRVSGQKRLFESPFSHQHFITLSISRADRTRDELHYNQVFPTEELIEISMSEVQFAHLVTSLNMGVGTPCTISRWDGKIIKEPAPDQTKQTFAHEAREHFTDLAAMAAELENLTSIKASEIKAEQRERMKFLALKIHQSVTGNMDFFHERFQETMDKVVVAAKTEIQAHVLNVVQKTGLTAIKNMELGFDEKGGHKT
jgi:hypothetical protein